MGIQTLPSAVTETSTARETTLYSNVEVDGVIYKYVKVASSSGAVAAGGVLFYLPGQDAVTDDVANSNANLVAGVNNTGSSISAAGGTAYYMWVAVRGRGISVTSDKAVAASVGSSLIASTTGTVKFVSAGVASTNKVIGITEVKPATAGVALIQASLFIE